MFHILRRNFGVLRLCFCIDWKVYKVVKFLIFMKTKAWAIGLVLFSTLLNTVAQISFKFASENFAFSFVGIIFNWPLLLGFGIYCVSAVLLIVSFRGGELSVLDPLQSASFVWTPLGAWLIVNEILTLMNVVGIGIIVSGILLMALANVGGGVR